MARIALVLWFGSFIGCASPGRQPASVVETQACTQRIATRITKGDPRVPEFIYRFGKKSILARQLVRGISAEEWAKSIRGPGSVWKLPPYRRGLYGCEKALRADRFASREEPALIRIRIRASCRRPERVASTYRIYEDPRFSRRLGEKYEEFRRNCIGADGDISARMYHVESEVTPTNRPLAYCEELIDRFLIEEGIQVVHDPAVDASWYIRDQGCVQSISGSPEELVLMFAEPGFLADDECGRSFESASTFRVFMDALLSISAPASSSVLRTIQTQWSRSGLSAPPTEVWLPDFIDTYLRCRAAGKLDLLRETARKFHEQLAGIAHYEQYLYLEGVDPDPGFSDICR